MTRVSTLWKPEGDQQILYMGEIKVGRVMASGGPRSIFHLKSFASWSKARTMEHAKQAVEQQLAEWLQRAGIQ